MPVHSSSYEIVCAPIEDSDQPAHPRSLIRVFAVRLKSLRIIGYPHNAPRRLLSDYVDAQADISLQWRTYNLVGTAMYLGFPMTRFNLDSNKNLANTIGKYITFLKILSKINNFKSTKGHNYVEDL